MILDYSDGLGITGASLGLGFRGRQMGDGSVMSNQYPGMQSRGGTLDTGRGLGQFGACRPEGRLHSCVSR